MVPTLAILIAPPAVAFLSWLQLNGGVLDAAARLFYGTALVFTALALTQVAKLRGQGFALSWWALSFPVAALTIATLRYGALAGSPAHRRRLSRARRPDRRRRASRGADPARGGPTRNLSTRMTSESKGMMS